MGRELVVPGKDWPFQQVEGMGPPGRVGVREGLSLETGAAGSAQGVFTLSPLHSFVLPFRCCFYPDILKPAGGAD